MSDLSELAQRILSEILEDRQNVPAAMNTVTDPAEDKKEIAEVQDAVKTLVEQDFATLAYRPEMMSSEKAMSKEDSLQVVKRVSDWLRFNNDEDEWDWMEDQPWIEIVATEKGREEADKILDDRGYQWWLRKA